MVAINHKLYDIYIYPTKNRFSHSSLPIQQANVEYIEHIFKKKKKKIHQLQP